MSVRPVDLAVDSVCLDCRSRNISERRPRLRDNSNYDGDTRIQIRKSTGQTRDAILTTTPKFRRDHEKRDQTLARNRCRVADERSESKAKH